MNNNNNDAVGNVIKEFSKQRNTDTKAGTKVGTMIGKGIKKAGLAIAKTFKKQPRKRRTIRMTKK